MHYSFLLICFSVPSLPSVTIEASGTSIAGETYSLTCTVSLEQELRQSPVIEWIGPDGSVIENGTIVDMSLSSSSPSTTMSLLFTRLRTSHKGIYWCRASVNDIDAGINIMNNSSAAIIVQSKSIGLVFIAAMCTLVKTISSIFFGGFNIKYKNVT